MEALPFILSYLGIWWHLYIDHVLKLIWNVCPSLCAIGTIWVFRFTNSFYAMYPAYLHLMRACSLLYSQFVWHYWAFMLSFNPPFKTPLPLPTKFDGTTSIDHRLIHMCLALVGVKWKVEHERVEECKDWKRRRRCNMQEGGML